MSNAREKLAHLIVSDLPEKDQLENAEAAGILADCLIANGVTVQGWIPTTDELPDPLVDVLVYDHTAGRVEIGFITSRFEWVGVCMNHEVTHWMPIPGHPSVTDKTDL